MLQQYWRTTHGEENKSGSVIYNAIQATVPEVKYLEQVSFVLVETGWLP